MSKVDENSWIRKILHTIMALIPGNSKVRSVNTEAQTVNNQNETDPYKLDIKKVESFALSEENEKSTAIELNSYRPYDPNEYVRGQEKIFYITDLHLTHKLVHQNAFSFEEISKVIDGITDTIVRESGSILLIGGDVSSDYKIFELFVKSLYRRNHSEMFGNVQHIFFILGNHELWDFPRLGLKEIVCKYKNLLDNYGMHLLQNEFACFDFREQLQIVPMEKILSLSDQEIRQKLRTSRINIIGGIGFSGYNNELNANNGIYRSTIDRKQEIEESDVFNGFYKKILSAIPDKKVIVFTHMPMDCWSETVDYQDKYIYLSGHTHRNYVYDDGNTRIYADNQIGYHINTTHLKFFDYDELFDYFADYTDGIYEISRDDYRMFYSGKNRMLRFNRDFDVLYMLKKNGYYCFFLKSNNTLKILHGGSITSVGRNDIQYYFDNMDTVIQKLKEPLDKYSAVQEKISHSIKKLGGSGTLHGCIIDIDFYNHVYINPIDLKITAYVAMNMIDKYVYPDIVSLLKDSLPEMYARYEQLLSGRDNTPVLYEQGNTDISKQPQVYLDTDIYKASREVNKLQRLESNILTTWYDPKQLDGKRLLK